MVDLDKENSHTCLVVLVYVISFEKVTLSNLSPVYATTYAPTKVTHTCTARQLKRLNKRERENRFKQKFFLIFHFFKFGLELISAYESIFSQTSICYLYRYVF